MGLQPKRDRKLSVALSDDDWQRLEKLLTRHKSRMLVVTPLSTLAYATLLAGLGVLEKHAERERRHTTST
jgi:hypothetical protein